MKVVFDTWVTETSLASLSGHLLSHDWSLKALISQITLSLHKRAKMQPGELQRSMLDNQEPIKYVGMKIHSKNSQYRSGWHGNKQSRKHKHVANQWSIRIKVNISEWLSRLCVRLGGNVHWCMCWQFFIQTWKNYDLHIKTSLSLSPSHQLSLFSSTHQGSTVCIHTMFLMSEFLCQCQKHPYVFPLTLPPCVSNTPQSFRKCMEIQLMIFGEEGQRPDWYSHSAGELSAQVSTCFNLYTFLSMFEPAEKVLQA